MPEECSEVIVGSYFLKLVAQMKKLAEQRRSVIVFGDTGTGKELLLKSYTDTLPSGDAILVNSAAFPGNLLEGILFGHVQGAFTGAYRATKGLVEKYKCIALDEIGDATPALQAKILRLLQSGDYLKVGDTRFRKNEDLVFIAATNKGPDALRDDLLWRFKARIYVPPLAERRSDLVDLLYAIATHEGIKEITERCLGFLIEEHEWPGNAREMQFMLLQARERAADEPIDLLHLPVLFVPPELGGTRGRWSDASDPAPVWKFDDSFCARAKKHFDVEVIAGLSDEDVQHALQRLAYHASQNPREEPQHIFYREVPKALHELVAATRDRRDGACVNLESRLQQAKTWHEAANIARGIWYEARMKEGKTHKELAALLGITAQAFGQQRHKYGILSLRWPGRK